MNGTLILVTGATGYVGGQLVQPLLDQGATVRVLSRNRSTVSELPWGPAVDVVEGTAADAADLDRALDGVDVAYYLMHAMDGAGDLAERERAMAHAFADAAARAGVRRIVYLGGMHPSGALSEHLAARAEVSRILLAGAVPTVVLQAAVILGGSSTSFEMLRYLTGRLPLMVTPKWVRNRLQPIAIEDVLHYLVGAASLEGEVNRTFDIGGPEVLTYAELMQRFATVTGRRRRVILPVPVVTPTLAAYWVGLVTPVDPAIAQPLVGSLVHEVTAKEEELRDLLPKPAGLVALDDALRAADAANPPDTGPANLVLAIALTAAAAGLGSWATDPNSRWYRQLDKPTWQPPPALFPLAWTALYSVIAQTSAATLTEMERHGRAEKAHAYRRAMAANLALNASWSAIFFRAHRPVAATVVSAALTVSSADLARRSGRVDANRGRRLAGYAAWTAFATLLTGAIARRNR